jgi:simple sugar transport system permease protein
MQTMKFERWLLPVMAIVVALIAGIFLILIAGENPITVYGAWFQAGFGCRGVGIHCALLTVMQYATPLTLSGLSAMVAFRAGLISIGQFGQMVLGAGVTTFLATVLEMPATITIPIAIFGGMLAGATWGILPGLLKAYLHVPEVITTLMLNPIAVFVVAPVSWRRIPDPLHLPPLVATTKLTVAFPIAIGVAIFIYFYMWRTGRGLEIRMAGQALDFAKNAGIHPQRAIVRGMAISGMLAGLAGSFEVLGVHYRFISNFSSIDQFDGITVSLLGQLHPFGIFLSALLIGGLRLGTLNGLQLQTAVPRELGNAIIALITLFVAIPPRHWQKIWQSGKQGMSKKIRMLYS